MKSVPTLTDFILERLRVLQANFFHQKTPCVLSCGGIYLPRRKTSAGIRQVLNLANEAEPIKVYLSGPKLASALHEVLAKESLN